MTWLQVKAPFASFSGSMTLVLRELIENCDSGVLNRNDDDKNGSTTLCLGLAPKRRIEYNRNLDNQDRWRHSSDTVRLLNQEV